MMILPRVCLSCAIASIGGSLLLFYNVFPVKFVEGNSYSPILRGIFVGLWAPTFLGVANYFSLRELIKKQRR